MYQVYIRLHNLLQAFVLMEYQSTHFDALPALFVLRARNVERGVWHASSTSVLLRVEALDEYHFLGAKFRFVEPSGSCQINQEVEI